jgi:hypothetical protein
MGDELDQGSEVSASGDDVADVGAADAGAADAGAADAGADDPAVPVDLAKRAKPRPAAAEPSGGHPDVAPQADPGHASDPVQSAPAAEPATVTASIAQPETPTPAPAPTTPAPPTPEPTAPSATTPAPAPTTPESVAPATPTPEPPAPTPAAVAPEQVSSAAFEAAVDSITTGLSALGDRVGEVANATAEFARLRSRDAELIGRLHDDVTRLRTGEIAAALNPVVTGMIKLHDQMISLGALSDPASPVGMLHTQLLQILELTCAVKPFAPSAGEQFDASHHTGARRIVTVDPAADGTVAATIKAGFVRADGSVVRVAEVEVHRLAG